jgi:CBS domain containing-hemolysin-like protein
VSLVYPLAFLYVVLAVAASAFFSGTEMALLSAERFHLRRMGREGRPGAERALAILQHRTERLATNLVGLNLFNVSASAVAAYLVERAAGMGWASSTATTLVMTTLLLVLGEIVPKIYARRDPNRLLARSARALDVVHLFFLPVTRALALYAQGILRLLGRREKGARLGREELKSLLRETRAAAGAQGMEHRMLHSILEFGETVAREVMIPITQVVAISREAGLEEWRRLVRRHGYTRLPVYEGRVDRLVGVVNVFDLFYEPKRGQRVSDYMRPLPVVPETKTIESLLVEMRRERQAMVAVVNEFGSCIGILTVEDIVEEIVGEMVDEHETAVVRIQSLGPRTWVVDALTDVDDVNEELGLNLPKDRYDTIGGLVLRHLGRIPRVGESVTVGSVRLEVLDVYRYGVRRVKLELTEGPRQEEG